MTSETLPDLNTCEGFLNERRDFLHVFVVPSPGDGFDVVVRMDGSYTELQDAQEAAVGIQQWLGGLKDLRTDKRKWWNGSPWQRQ